MAKHCTRLCRSIALYRRKTHQQLQHQHQQREQQNQMMWPQYRRQRQPRRQSTPQRHWHPNRHRQPIPNAIHRKPTKRMGKLSVNRHRYRRPVRRKSMPTSVMRPPNVAAATIWLAVIETIMTRPPQAMPQINTTNAMTPNTMPYPWLVSNYYWFPSIGLSFRCVRHS